MLAVGLLPGVASAHDPIIIDDSQTTPELGPLLLDGTISFALYGAIDAAGDTRGFRVRMEDGDRLQVQMLVPDLAPENELVVDDLPQLTIESPDGQTWTLGADVRVPFDEPFSRTRYLRLLDFSEAAVAGDYRVTVSGAKAARFTVSVGVIERFGTAVENVVDRDAGVPAVIEWYSTTPGDDAGDGTESDDNTDDNTDDSTDTTTEDASTGGDTSGSGGPRAGFGLGAVVLVVIVVALFAVAKWGRREFGSGNWRGTKDAR